MNSSTERARRYHKRNCENVSLLSRNNFRHKTDPVTEVPVRNHSNLDRLDMVHMTHSSGTDIVPPEFEIKLPLNTPKAGDKTKWDAINRDFQLLIEAGPVYLHSDPPECKLRKLNNLTYCYFEAEYGNKEIKEKTKMVKRNKNDEKKKLRSLKRKLKRDWRKNRDSDNVRDPKKDFFRVTRLLNIIRPRDMAVEKSKDFQKQTKLFRKDPNKFARRLFNKKCNPNLKLDMKNAYNYFNETYSDLDRGMVYQTPPGLIRPTSLGIPFNMSLPSEEGTNPG